MKRSRSVVCSWNSCWLHDIISYIQSAFASENALSRISRQEIEEKLIKAFLYLSPKPWTLTPDFCKVEFLPQHMVRFERAVLDGGVSTPLAVSEKVRRWDPEPVKDYVQRVLAEDSKVLGVSQEEVEQKLSEVISSTVADGAYLEDDLRSLPYPHNLIRAEHAQAHLELTQWLSKTIVDNYPIHQVGHILLDHK